VYFYVVGISVYQRAVTGYRIISLVEEAYSSIGWVCTVRSISTISTVSWIAWVTWTSWNGLVCWVTIVRIVYLAEVACWADHIDFLFDLHCDPCNNSFKASWDVYSIRSIGSLVSLLDWESCVEGDKASRTKEQIEPAGGAHDDWWAGIQISDHFFNSKLSEVVDRAPYGSEVEQYHCCYISWAVRAGDSWSGSCWWVRWLGDVEHWGISNVYLESIVVLHIGLNPELPYKLCPDTQVIAGLGGGIPGSPW